MKKLKIFEPDSTIASQFYMDIGYSCNMNCKFCYDSENRANPLFNPSTKEDLIEVLNKINFNHPNRSIISIMIFGGEPTLYDDLLDIVEFTKKYPIELVVTTNGLRIASDDDYAKELFGRADRRVMFTTDWTWGGDVEYGKEIYNRDPEFKLEFLEQLKKYKRRRNHLFHIVDREYNIERIKNTIEMGKQHKSISVLSFNSNANAIDKVKTREFIDILVKENIVTYEEVQHNTLLEGSMFEECEGKDCCIRFKHDRMIYRFCEFDNTECWMRNQILPNNKLSYLFEFLLGRNDDGFSNIEEIIK